VALAFFGELTHQEVRDPARAARYHKTRIRSGLLKLRVPLMSLVAV